MKKDTKYGRPIDPTKVGRRAFTTVLQKDLINKLKVAAINKGLSAADLLEDILKKTFA